MNKTLPLLYKLMHYYQYFELEEKVVNISNLLHMEKKQNKETENKFQKLLAKYVKVKRNQRKYLHVKRN